MTFFPLKRDFKTNGLTRTVNLGQKAWVANGKQTFRTENEVSRIQVSILQNFSLVKRTFFRFIVNALFSYVTK